MVSGEWNCHIALAVHSWKSKLLSVSLNRTPPSCTGRSLSHLTRTRGSVYMCVCMCGCEPATCVPDMLGEGGRRGGRVWARTVCGVSNYTAEKKKCEATFVWTHLGWRLWRKMQISSLLLALLTRALFGGRKLFLCFIPKSVWNVFRIIILDVELMLRWWLKKWRKKISEDMKVKELG